nr:mitochondrial ribosome-associated GTPase 1 isoform X3 [Salvelinus alpinus]
MRLHQILRNAANFRTVFDFGDREVAHWFPRHMAKGLKQMQASVKNVDCILEIHDARIPFSGRNPLFQDSLDVRPHLLVLNKMDLADLSAKHMILKQLERHGVKKVLFTDCLRQRDDNVKKFDVPRRVEYDIRNGHAMHHGLQRQTNRRNVVDPLSNDKFLELVPMVTELIESQPRFHREENTNFCLMVIGVPNVGKSSLINALRRTNLKKGRGSKVGGEPGITKAVLTRIQVCERPIIHLLDTPGVLPPKIQSLETGMKLALCAL